MRNKILIITVFFISSSIFCSNVKDAYPLWAITTGLSVYNEIYNDEPILINYEISAFCFNAENMLNDNSLLKPYIGTYFDISNKLDNFSLGISVYLNSFLHSFFRANKKLFNQEYNDFSLLPILKLGLDVNNIENQKYGIKYSISFPIPYLEYVPIYPYMSQTYLFNGEMSFEYGVNFKIPVYVNKYLFGVLQAW